MSITKIQSESLNLSDTYDFTGTVTGAGESNTPAFKVYASTTQDIPQYSDTLINFDTEIYDVGNCFNTTNKEFTATSAGKYFFHSQIAQDAAQTGRVTMIHAYVNSTKTESNGYFREYLSGTNYRFQTQFTITLDLSLNDTVKLYFYTDADSNFVGTAVNNKQTYWSGFKILT